MRNDGCYVYQPFTCIRLKNGEGQLLLNMRPAKAVGEVQLARPVKVKDVLNYGIAAAYNVKDGHVCSSCRIKKMSCPTKVPSDSSNKASPSMILNVATPS